MTPDGSPITILGLGPGRWDQLTIEAREALAATGEVWLRTSRHPVVTNLPPDLIVHSFDYLDESVADFAQIDRAIAEEVLRLADRPGGVLYAVPGHPLVGEASVQHLIAATAARGYQPRIVLGLSFLDVAIARLGIDPLDRQLQIGDAHDLRADPARPLLIGQLHDRRLAGAAKLVLLEEYPADHPVTLIQSAGLDGADRKVRCQSIREIPLFELDRQDDLDHLTCAYLPAVPPERDFRTFAAARRIVAQLRAPGGCPWDRAQTAETLKPYVIEEAYEVVDAIDSGDPAKLAEELGDLLLQVVLHAQLADEAGDFAIADVIEAITTKLVRRHPHVFGDLQVKDAREVLANWETLKDRERAPGSSLLHGLPRHLPALAYARALQRKLARFGLPVDRLAAEARAGLAAGADEAPATPTGDSLRRELGRLLWRLTALAATEEIDLEDALRTLNWRYVAAYERAEAAAGGDRAATARLADAEWRALD